jgi:diguanylate cyclase (GGDEF)-like protein/PAS domain S-box-containing protein
MDISLHTVPLSECINNELFFDGNVSVFFLKNDLKWSIEDISPNIEYFIGYSKKELQEKNTGFLDLLHKEDIDKILNGFKKTLKENKKTWTSKQIRILKNDGSFLWVDAKFFLIKDSKNRVVYIIGYMVNISKEIEEKNLLGTVTDLVPVGIYLYENNKLVYINKKAVEISGYSEEEIKNSDFIKFVYPEDRPFIEKILKMRKIGLKDVLSYRIRIVTKNEKIKWIQITSKIIFYEGRFLGIGIVQDIDKIIQLELAKELLQKINRAMVGSSNKFALIKSVCDVFKNFGNFRGILACKVENRQLIPIYRISKNNFLNSIDCKEIPELEIFNKDDLLYIPDIGKLRNYLKWKITALSNKTNSLIVLPIKYDGEIKFVISLYIEEKNYFSKDVLEVFSEIAKDISFGLNYIKKEEDLFFKEFYDSLTKIGNRNYFINNLKKYIKKNRSFYLIMLDIYNFKYLNEKFGKYLGDKILKEVAAKLDKNLKYENIFRIGNDEFMIISTSEDIYTLIEKIREILKEIKIENTKLKLDYNLGIVKYPDDSKEINDLILKAERTLEIAKKSGKNEVAFFDKNKYELVKQTIYLEEKIEQAIKNDEFTLYFQPIVSVRDSTIKGFEVLIRWIDQNGNIINPSQFIPIAEKTGQAKEIDILVIEKLLNLLKKIQNKSILIHRKRKPKIIPIKNLRFSINITPSHIGEISSYLKQISKNEEIKSLKKHITLELTERQSLEIYTEKKNINKLRKMGFKIAIDDFGTGYSSLSYLAELNVNYVKIDMVFIQKMLTDQRMHKLVHSIINIAKIFGIKTIAEGVETYKQLKELKKLGCNMYQGFYYSPPLTTEEFENLLI